MNRLVISVVALLSTVLSVHVHAAELLNVSYDVSRELFDVINPAFAAEWKAKTGETIVIRQSHGGSSKQARSVLEGLQADVVTLNQFTDIDILRQNGLVADDWQRRLPNDAVPYYSLPIFLVREKNPKNIRDWNDLVRTDVQIIVPNPKTSGNGRYSYLAAYIYALEKNGGDRNKAKEFVSKLLANVAVFDTGGRGATTTFIERQIGDVLITFESEVAAIRTDYTKASFDAVVPSLSLRADFPVAVVDKVVDRKGTRKLATAYLEYLFSAAGQEQIAKRYFRVQSKTIADKYKEQFPAVKLATVEQSLGSWTSVSQQHFADGGILDQALLRED
jgi:sulfate/thiosulfate transport system substrate-binding protein